jgi:beta-N-acetylhexosaminidase
MSRAQVPKVQAVGETTSLADHKRQAGQRLVIGIKGPTVDDDARALIRELQPAGFVLFARNVVEPAQVLDLNRELASLVRADAPPLICVDQEGGRVQRIRATRWPSMRVAQRSGVPIREISAGIARELRAMGFHLNFAPVADVDSNPANPVIGDRSFATTAAGVSAALDAFIEGHHAEGLATCAKHFPGHGDTHQDSHHHLPVVEREAADLQEVELAPFGAAVRAKVASVMTAHVIYPAWDEEWPATLSTKIIPTFLRKGMGFDGVVFSDDLEMKAVHGRYEIPQLVTRANLASVDVFLACEHAELQHRIFQELVRQQESDRTFETNSQDASHRVMALRERFLRGAKPPPPLAVVGCAEHQRLAQRAIEQGS